MPPPAVKRDIHGRLLNDKGHAVDNFDRELDDFNRPKTERLIHGSVDVPFPGCASILLAYPTFADWRSMYDPRRNRGMAVDRQIYDEFKTRHQKQMTALLREISGRAVGRAVIAEACASSFVVRVFPIEFVESQDFFMKYHRNAIATNDDQVSAVSLGMHAGTQHFKRGDEKMTRNLSGTGQGSDANVFFSPGRIRKGRPGSNADETLLHEMVHAVRGMNGVNTQSFRMGGHWDNLEEFTAVTVENVYLSEKKQTALRANHGRDTMKNPAKFFESDDVPPPGARMLISGFRHQMPRMFAALSAIGAGTAVFNPFRQLAEETKNASAAHNAKMKSFDGRK